MKKDFVKMKMKHYYNVPRIIRVGLILFRINECFLNRIFRNWDFVCSQKQSISQRQSHREAEVLQFPPDMQMLTNARVIQPGLRNTAHWPGQPL